MGIKQYSINNTVYDFENRYPAAVKKYLTKYALKTWTLVSNFEGEITNAIIVPAIGEFDNLTKLLTSLSANSQEYFSSTIVIFVINNTPAHNDEIKHDNIKSINFLRALISKDIGENKITAMLINSGMNIGLIDASTPGNEMPEKEGGVGFARKLGMDLALTIFNYSSHIKKILICLDADCNVEKNYLTEIINNFNNKNLSAAAVKFEHASHPDEEIERAIICYEIFLHYYVLGLKYAGSPYAFHTIGSTMICDFESYIKIEGMNKKKAAEDFYFLEKLAKNVKVGQITTTKVYPAARRSWRVPFGTGQRINRFVSKSQDEYRLYNPRTFKILKQWLAVFQSEEQLSGEELLIAAERIDKSLYQFLIMQKFEDDWGKILRNSSNITQIQKQKKLWFDGFRTLKLIHFLRDNGYPLINMFDALDELFKKLELYLPLRNDVSIPGIDVQKEYLNILRKRT